MGGEGCLKTHCTREHQHLQHLCLQGIDSTFVRHRADRDSGISNLAHYVYIERKRDGLARSCEIWSITWLQKSSTFDLHRTSALLWICGELLWVYFASTINHSITIITNHHSVYINKVTTIGITVGISLSLRSSRSVTSSKLIKQ